VSSPSQKPDEGPIREGWSLKKLLKRFLHREEPADATSPVILRPTFFRRQPVSIRPFPPRTLALGLPFLPRLVLHFNSTRQGQPKGWNFLGNRITWTVCSASEFRLRRRATQQVIRDIEQAEGKLPKGDARDPRFSSSGSFGFPWISKLSKALRSNPYYQWGFGEKAGTVNPLTMEFLNKDPQGRIYDPQNPNADPFGNVIGYGMDGQPIYGGPLIDPTTYGQFGMGMPYGQYPSQFAMGYDPSTAGNFMGNPYLAGNDPTRMGMGMGMGMGQPYGLYGVPPGSDPTFAATDPRMAMLNSYADPYATWSQADDPLGQDFGNDPDRYVGRRIRGAPPSRLSPMGDGLDPDPPPPPLTSLDRSSAGRSLTRDIGFDQLR
jgi:hypothetical protein